MTLNEIKLSYIKTLSDLYPDSEILSILQILCEDLLHWSRTDFFIRDRDELNHLQEEILKNALFELLQSKPVQHITGIAHFMGHEFVVDEHTLIPRQETEELVALIEKNHASQDIEKIIDIGTGTGCIGICLGLAFAKAELILIDVSEQALSMAKKNAARMDREQRTQFLQEDILSLSKLPTADLIVSNPPYVRELEKVEIHDNVLKYEPATALFVPDNDALKFYRKIMQLAQESLKPNGFLYFEINQYLNEEIKILANSLNFNCETYRDLNGNWRMMKCWRKAV
jgi:release factor glutamine methyltransferase